MSRARGGCHPPSTLTPLLMGLLGQQHQAPHTGGVRRQKYPYSRFWRPETRVKVSAGPRSLPGSAGSPSHLSLPCGGPRLIKTALHPPSVFTWPTFLGLIISRSLSKCLPNQSQVYDHTGQRAGVCTGSVPTADGDTGSGGNDRAPPSSPPNPLPPCPKLPLVSCLHLSQFSTEVKFLQHTLCCFIYYFNFLK